MATERQIGLRKRTRPFTQIPNDVVDDFTIGYRELGLLLRILRMPEGFVIRSEQLSTEGRGKTLRGRAPDREGREAVRTSLRKLALGGYYRLVKQRCLDGTFCMATDISEDPVEAWAAQAQIFDGRYVPVYEQEDGTFHVKYPDGSFLDEDEVPPPSAAQKGVEQEPKKRPAKRDAKKSQVEGVQTPETGFRAPANPAPGDAGTGACAPLSKTVKEDGQKESSVPASQVRRDSVEDEDFSVEGQILIDGSTEPSNLPAQRSEPSAAVIANQLAMGVGRSWLDMRTQFDCPLVWGKSGDPLMALRRIISAAADAGYSETEIKFALMWADRSVPTMDRLEAGLVQVRRNGWRPASDWRPGEARNGFRPQAPKASTTDERVNAALALAEKYRLEDEAS
jgi:hypothetical protein